MEFFLLSRRMIASLPPSRFFPPAENADPDGVVGFGGKLTPEWLLDAYQHGIFPWPTGNPSLPVPWCSPDPRAIFELDRFHVPRRLRQTCRSGKFRVTFDRDFSGVIRGCATSGTRRGQTWLTAPMIRAYTQLFELGHCHSVEVWQDERLAGGTYGLAIGGTVRGGIDVLSRSATLRRWPWYGLSSDFDVGVMCSWISSNLRRTQHNLGLSSSRVRSICGVWRRRSAFRQPSAIRQT